jgi:hypothetical protein
MAATSWDPKQPSFLVRGTLPEIVYGETEKNSQTFKAGALVYIDGTNGVAACADDATSIDGIAMKDATNVTSGNIEIPIMKVEPQHLLKMRVSSAGTAALASTATHGVRYAIDIDANGVATVDTADSGTATKNCVQFVQPIYDVNGDSTYWAEVHITGGDLDGAVDERS